MKSSRSGVRDFLKRRWLEFRWGHTFYFAFILSMTNFILISYHFLFIKFNIDIVTYSILFIIAYPIGATIVGHLHVKYQYTVEQQIMFQQILEELRLLRERLERLEYEAV